MKSYLSPEQQICYIYDESWGFLYEKDISIDPIEAAIEIIDVVEALQPIFEPTSADLRLGCAKKEDSQWDIKINAPETGVEREFGSSGFALSEVWRSLNYCISMYYV